MGKDLYRQVIKTGLQPEIVKLLPVFLLFCLLTPGISAVVITEFCPDTYLKDDPDEYVVLSGTGSLEGIIVSDGEGGFRFPPGSRIEGLLTVAYNGKAYANVHDRQPDYEFYNFSPDIPDVAPSGPFRLANSGDELMLYDQENLVQKVSWPADVRPREGQVHFMDNGTWDTRVLMLGQSRIAPANFTGVTGVCFVSPDCSLELYLNCIEQADHEILLNVYEFSSPIMADALTSARKRGVNVTVLVEGGPVGGITPEGNAIFERLTRNNITVYRMGTIGDNHAPYRYNHAKYIVADSLYLFITSENFKGNGFPAEGKSGNRGWGVCFIDPGVAGYFRDLFLSDINGKGISPITGKAGPMEPDGGASHAKEFSPQRFESAKVTPVLSPDTSYLISDLLCSATSRIDIEQAYISNESKGVPNRFLSNAINASRRGVQVRVLLDSYWFNTEGEDDNDEMMAYINQVAVSEHLPLEARCAELDRNELEKIHNKGVIVDRNKVLVSSINWNYNSPTFNREAGVIIEQPEAAEYFGAVFEDDWGKSTGSDKTQDTTVGPLKIGIAVLVVALLLLLYWRRKNN
jgi:phosphatidylserine/phosphatidylglycerophosphate/cardiolipin synthase-like enzyme